MSPSLEAMLDELSEHHLRRTVADRWNLQLPATDDLDEIVASMAEAMRRVDRVAAVVDRLYGDLRRVLYHLALRDGVSSSSRISEQVFEGDLWRTKQSLEELHNYQLVLLTQVDELQGSYPEYRAQVPDDLLEPLRDALGLRPVDPAKLRVEDPSPVHREGYNTLRDAVAVLELADEGLIGRTKTGDLRKRSLKAAAELVTDDDPKRLEWIVASLEDLGVLVRDGARLRPLDSAAETMLADGPAYAQALLVAGALDAEVPPTGVAARDLLWTLPALADLPDGWLVLDDALDQIRLAGLQDELKAWFGRSLDQGRRFLTTVAPTFGLVDLADDDEAIRLTPLAHALLGTGDPPRSEDGRVVVDPSLQVNLFQDPPDPKRLRRLLTFTEVEHLGPATRLRLTREALWDGLSEDLSLDDALDLLGGDVPDSVQDTLQGWADRYERVDLERTWVLSVRDEALLDDVLADDEIADHLDRLGPRHARVLDPDVADALDDAGLLARPPEIPRSETGSTPRRGDVRFDEALDDLAEALGVGRPQWLGGGARYGGPYEA